MREFIEVIGDIDFNRDDDRKEYGLGNRVVTLNNFEDEGRSKLGLSFNLGRKEDDSITLVFDWDELLFKLLQ